MSEIPSVVTGIRTVNNPPPMATYRIVMRQYGDGRVEFYPQVRVLRLFWKGVGVSLWGKSFECAGIWIYTAETIEQARLAIKRHRRDVLSSVLWRTGIVCEAAPSGGED